MTPPALKRKSAPVDKRKADESACLAGGAEACRRMADRFRGYGHPAGCGIERPGPTQSIKVQGGSALSVRIKRMSGDTHADRRNFFQWINKACDLGDEEACGIARTARLLSDLEDDDLCLRSDPDSSALWAFQKATGNQDFARRLTARKDCLSNPGDCCAKLTDFLYHRGDQSAPSELGAELRGQALTICERTLDCDAVLMMLDKNGYTPDMLAPVREHAAKVLLGACLDGACVCGDAAKTMALDDARMLDISRMGCDNGEAEGCYALGRLYEEGRGVPKDAAAARSLYEAACPPVRPQSGPLVGDYSPRACDRLAEMYEALATPPKDLDRALYYAEFACLHPGFERDHAPCIRLSRYRWSSAGKPGEGAEKAAEILNGPKSAPVDGKECQRPSVKALCDKVEKDITTGRK